MPELLKCPSCQGNLEIEDESRAVIRCAYCGSSVAVRLTCAPNPSRPARRWTGRATFTPLNWMRF